MPNSPTYPSRPAAEVDPHGDFERAQREAAGLAVALELAEDLGCERSISMRTVAKQIRGYAEEITALKAENERLRAALTECDWHSPHETPGFCGTSAIRVLVRLEPHPNPPALNAPDRYAFGHRIVRSDKSDHWPSDGWCFDGQEDGYRVVAWRYVDMPEVARAALGEKP